MKKYVLIWLLGLLLLPVVVFAKPVLYLGQSGCMIYWQVKDDCTGATLGQGSYWDPGCQVARPAEPDSTAISVLLPSHLEAIRGQVREQLHLSTDDVTAMPCLSGQFDVVVTPGTDAVPASLRSVISAYLGTSSTVHIAESVEFVPKFGEIACYVQECTVFPVPFSDFFTLRFDCTARTDVNKAVIVTAIPFADQNHPSTLYTGTFGKGLTTLDIDTRALPKGRHCLQVTVGRYSRTFDVIKQ